MRPLFDVEADSREGGEVEDVDLLFPLLKWRTAAEESKSEARPLLFTGHTAEERWTTVFPFLWTGEERRQGEVRKEWTHLWPVYGRHRDGTRTDDWYVAPLAHHASDPAEELEGWDVLFPLDPDVKLPEHARVIIVATEVA